VSETTAEQAHLFVHNVVLGILKNESRTTRSVLAAVPNGNLDYRPDSCAKTANEPLRHVASADNFFLKSVVDGVFVPGSVKISEAPAHPCPYCQRPPGLPAQDFYHHQQKPRDGRR
jgi:hypothetical protein